MYDLFVLGDLLLRIIKDGVFSIVFDEEFLFKIVFIILVGFCVSLVLILIGRDCFIWGWGWGWGWGMYDMIMVFMILVCLLMVFFIF